MAKQLKYTHILLLKINRLLWIELTRITLLEINKDLILSENINVVIQYHIQISYNLYLCTYFIAQNFCRTKNFLIKSNHMQKYRYLRPHRKQCSLFFLVHCIFSNAIDRTYIKYEQFLQSW